MIELDSNGLTKSGGDRWRCDPPGILGFPAVQWRRGRYPDDQESAFVIRRPAPIQKIWGPGPAHIGTHMPQAIGVADRIYTVGMGRSTSGCRAVSKPPWIKPLPGDADTSRERGRTTGDANGQVYIYRGGFRIDRLSRWVFAWAGYEVSLIFTDYYDRAERETIQPLSAWPY